MGLLMFILRRSWALVALTLVIVLMVAIVNYDPIASHMPSYKYIRQAVNSSLPIVSAIVVGLFAQGIGMIYNLFMEAVRKHKEELKEASKFLLDELKGVNEPAYFNYRSNVADSSYLYMHIESPLCEAYKRAKERFGDLLEDIGNHWPKAGDVLRELEELCNNINEHNNSVRMLEMRLKDQLEEEVKSYVITRLQGLNTGYFLNFVMNFMLVHLVPKVVNNELSFREVTKEYVANVYDSLNFEAKIDNLGHLEVGIYNIGKVNLNDWKRHGKDVVINVVYRVLAAYAHDLDELVERGEKLKSRAKELLNELKEHLSGVEKAGILPLRKICKYLS